MTNAEPPTSHHGPPVARSSVCSDSGLLHQSKYGAASQARNGVVRVSVQTFFMSLVSGGASLFLLQPVHEVSGTHRREQGACAGEVLTADCVTRCECRQVHVGPAFVEDQSQSRGTGARLLPFRAGAVRTSLQQRQSRLEMLRA